MQFKFPKDFLFGCASSACQIESASRKDGKGEDVKDHYYLIHPEKFRGANPDKSADFYYKYDEDIKMMQELGLKCFRFSISWSRIYPNGPEKVNQAGIDYYYDLMVKLKKAGMTIFFDLWHCDLPYWVEVKGGVLDKGFQDWFTIYAETCFKAFGDLVDYWCTVNEPSINVMAAYAHGVTAPFLKDMDSAIKASHNMIIAHYKALRIYKSLGLKGKIGAVIHVEPTYGITNSDEDMLAAKRGFAFYSGMWLEPMFNGRYPEITLEYSSYIKDKLPKSYQEDLDKYFIPNDFVAVNYYSPAFYKANDDGILGYEKVVNEKLPKDDYGFTIYPPGLYDVVSLLHEMFPDKDILITENGIGIKKWGNYEEEAKDEYRVDYLREHLRQVSRAISAGIPLKAYMHWSILDTNELYSGGYTMMFGLTQVRYDKEDKQRVRRDSWYYYQKVIKDGLVN